MRVRLVVHDVTVVRARRGMPAGRFGPAYLVTPNFYALKSYNNSDLYALYVGTQGAAPG